MQYLVQIIDQGIVVLLLGAVQTKPLDSFREPGVTEVQ